MKKIIVVGGGAAGMMAAISASSKNNQVLLFEKNEKPGKKLFITGKGRCNVTNACPMDELHTHVITNPKFLYSAFHSFTNRDMISFLEKEGVRTKVERGQRVFPVSDHSSDIIRALKAACVRAGVEICCYTEVTGIETERNKEDIPCFKGVRLKDGRMIAGHSLIIATGGYSYRSTGSTGDGYRFARDLGHSVKEPEPSLVPFVMKEAWCKDLMGLSLKNVAIQIKDGKKRIYEGFGEFLFTHFGVSGPLVLTASTRLGTGKAAKALKQGSLKLLLDLKPALDEEQLEKRFLREFDTWRNKNISNVLDQMLPRKMVPVFLGLAEIPADKKVRDISRQERRRMEGLMKSVPMHITGVRGFDEAIITRGGVSVREIDPGTMESKRVRNVYFAGEVLDVDAETGGYNLQIAWSTGYTAGVSAGRESL